MIRRRVLRPLRFARTGGNFHDENVHDPGALTAALLLAGGALVAADVKSGPQVGSRRIPPFNPLHCNGSGAGGKACLV